MRTDRTWVCVPCALRCSAAACPRCGGADNFDLRDPRAAEKIARSTRRAGPEARRARALTRVIDWYEPKHHYFLFTLPIPLAVYAMLRTFGDRLLVSPRLFFFYYLVQWIALAFLGAITRTVLEMKRDDLADHGVRPFTLAAAPPVADSFKRGQVRGRVRCPRPLSAPLSRRSCAAFRVLGSGAFGPIDDGQVAPFEVITDEGVVVRVDSATATLVLETFGKRVSLTPEAKPLVEFLVPRGLALASGPVTIQEALLRPGDEVLVEGSFDEIAQPFGYRDSAAAIRIFKELDGSPLIIRDV